MIGRTDEVAQAAALLHRQDVRLLTLTGVGGVGKTRLALEVASILRPTFPDGVFFVPLASLRDPELVAVSMVQTLGLHERGGEQPSMTLSTSLRDKHLLLVLDNFEHVLSAAAVLSLVLAACPGVKLLVTSRALLQVRGEQALPVAPFLVPDPAAHLPLEALAASPAVALFVERAHAVQPEFALTPENVGDVVAICRRLDGLPLALELAAARIRLLPARALLARLERRLPLLVGGARDLPERQRTLRNTIAWSYELLSAAEQALLRRLSVFVGGAMLEAVESVCTLDEASAAEMLERLAALVNHSLLRQEASTAGDARVGMLETIREYTVDQLEASGEAAATRDRHLAWCLALAEEAEPHLTGTEQGFWLARLERDHDNLRAALRWAQERGDGEGVLRLAGALWRFWYTRGHLGEGRGWLEAALSGAADAPAARAKALNGAGSLANRQGEYRRAAAQHEEALGLFRALGDTWGSANALGNLGLVALRQGEYGRAVDLIEEGLGLFRALGDTWGSASLLNNLGNVVLRQGDQERAAALYEEALGLFRALGNTLGSASALGNLGLVAFRQGEYGRAVTLIEESLGLYRALGDTLGSANTLGNLGLVALRQGNQERAGALIEEGLTLGRDIGARNVVAENLESLAWLAVGRNQPQRATRLGGAAEALREALGVSLRTDQRAGHDPAVQAMRAALGEEDFAAAWAAGRALPLEQVIAEALADA